MADPWTVPDLTPEARAAAFTTDPAVLVDLVAALRAARDDALEEVARAEEALGLYVVAARVRSRKGNDRG